MDFDFRQLPLIEIKMQQVQSKNGELPLSIWFSVLNLPLFVNISKLSIEFNFTSLASLLSNVMP